MLNPKNGFAIVLILVFAIASVVLTHPQSAPAVSGVSGLITLKTMAQTATPYDVAIANPKPTLIEFYADWCTTCQRLSPTMNELHDQWGDRINFVMLNIDDPHWARQIKQFQVNGVPNITLMDSEQTAMDVFIGNTPKSILEKGLTQLLAINS